MKIRVRPYIYYVILFRGLATSHIPQFSTAVSFPLSYIRSSKLDLVLLREGTMAAAEGALEWFWAFADCCKSGNNAELPLSFEDNKNLCWNCNLVLTVSQ